MVRVNSFWSRRCQFGNRGDLCLILARCNQENNRWLCLRWTQNLSEEQMETHKQYTWLHAFLRGILPKESLQSLVSPIINMHTNAKRRFSVIGVVRDLRGKFHFQVAFYYGQPKAVIIMLSNQHLDMPHLWGGWIISAKEKCSLTRFRQTCEQYLNEIGLLCT